jgi:hypothetical protein
VRSRDAALAAMTAMLSACTVFSGWGDLQGGTRNSDGGSAAPDASKPANDAATTPDVGAPTETGSPEASVQGVTCGASYCSLGSQGCCVQGGGAGTCENATQCATAGFFLACDSSGQCGAGRVCCFDVGLSNGASCVTSCTSTVLCSPQSPSDCTPPKQCRLGTLPPGYYTCQ